MSLVQKVKHMVAPPRRIKVLSSFADQYRGVMAGSICQLVDSATSWPEPFRSFIADGTVEVLDPRAELPAHVPVLPIDPAFWAKKPTAPPLPPLLDRAAIMATFGWDLDRFEQARAFGFPKPCAERWQRRGSLTFGETRVFFWDREVVRAWCEQLLALAGTLPGGGQPAA